jgi:hypothetical protein
MKTILSSFIALSLLMGASTAFARNKSDTPKNHTKKKHSKSGKNRGGNSHKSGDNVPSSN